MQIVPKSRFFAFPLAVAVALAFSCAAVYAQDERPQPLIVTYPQVPQSQPLINRGLGQQFSPGIINRSRDGLLLKSLLNSQNYVVTPGDTYALFIVFNGSQRYSLTVHRDHTLEVPYLGTIESQGLDYTRLRDQILTQIKRILPADYVEFTLESPSQYEVFVGGAVRQAGIVIANPTMRLGDVITIAGGLTNVGSIRRISLLREDTGGRTIDISRFAHDGDTRHNPFVRPGDRIVVPKTESLIAIDGAITYPGLYELVQGESLTDLIEMAGGLTAGSSNTIGVIRYGHLGEFEIMDVAMDSNPDFALQGGDKVVVKPGYVNSPQIVVSGAIYGQQHDGTSAVLIPTKPIQVAVPYIKGLSVLKVLENLGGYTPYAQSDRAVIIRKGGMLISFDARMIWERRVEDIVLDPQDRIIIPFSNVDLGSSFSP